MGEPEVVRKALEREGSQGGKEQAELQSVVQFLGGFGPREEHCISQAWAFPSVSCSHGFAVYPSICSEQQVQWWSQSTETGLLLVTSHSRTSGSVFSWPPEWFSFVYICLRVDPLLKNILRDSSGGKLSKNILRDKTQNCVISDILLSVSLKGRGSFYRRNPFWR